MGDTADTQYQLQQLEFVRFTGRDSMDPDRLRPAPRKRLKADELDFGQLSLHDRATSIMDLWPLGRGTSQACGHRWGHGRRDGRVGVGPWG